MNNAYQPMVTRAITLAPGLDTGEVVNVWTGERRSCFIERGTRSYDGSPFTRAYSAHQITKRGTVDQRAKGDPVGVSISPYDGKMHGHFAFPLPGDGENRADAVRARIAEMEAALHAEKQALLKLYASAE